MTSEQLMSTTPPVRDTSAILYLLQGHGIPFRRKGDNFVFVLLAQVWPENFLLLSCHQNISSESDESECKQRHKTNWRPNRKVETEPGSMVRFWRRRSTGRST